MSTTTLAPTTHRGQNGSARNNETLLTVTFRIGRQQYGLPVSVVIEIVRLPALLTLAGAPPAIIGLLNLRGHYLPVLDGSILIDEQPSYDLNSQIVVAGRIALNGSVEPILGLRVDQVIDVRTLHMNRTTMLDRSVSASFLKYVFNTDDGSLLLFDMDVLMTMVPQGTEINAMSEHHMEHL
jgi:purine-binding chemotaxis protein CheW